MQNTQSDYTLADWQLEVASGDTKRGFHEWVAAQEEQDRNDPEFPRDDNEKPTTADNPKVYPDPSGLLGGMSVISIMNIQHTRPNDIVIGAKPTSDGKFMGWIMQRGAAPLYAHPTFDVAEDALMHMHRVLEAIRDWRFKEVTSDPAPAAPTSDKSGGHLSVEFGKTDCEASLDITIPGTAEPVQLYADWYGDNKKKLQVIVGPADTDENAVYIRFNDNGSLHSIVVEDPWWSLVRREGAEACDWTKERDGES